MTILRYGANGGIRYLRLAVIAFALMAGPAGYSVFPDSGMPAVRVPCLQSLTDRQRSLALCYGFDDRVPPNTVYDFYHILGRTYPELCAEIFDREKGKGSWNAHEQVRYAAQANYAYTWNGDYERTRGAVRWKNIRVEVRNTLNFPFWNMPEDADAKAREQWQKFIQPLKEHEFEHIRIYNEMTDTFRKTMRSLSASSGKELYALTRKAFRDFINEVDARGAAYDTATSHGRTQGAIF